MMMANRPQYKNYPTWNKQAFYDDSAQWVDNPLYGWCNKNHKADGRPYNIYTDGLKIYTTIDSKMQQYAEEAVKEHMQKLQNTFWHEKGISSNGTGKPDPYRGASELSDTLKRRLIKYAIFASKRAQTLKAQGKTNEQILNDFDTPRTLTIWDPINGEREQTMTPKDSLLFAKSILTRCSLQRVS